MVPHAPCETALRRGPGAAPPTAAAAPSGSIGCGAVVRRRRAAHGGGEAGDPGFRGGEKGKRRQGFKEPIYCVFYRTYLGKNTEESVAKIESGHRPEIFSSVGSIAVCSVRQLASMHLALCLGSLSQTQRNQGKTTTKRERHNKVETGLINSIRLK